MRSRTISSPRRTRSSAGRSASARSSSRSSALARPSPSASRSSSNGRPSEPGIGLAREDDHAVGQPVDQLADEAGLADAGLAADQGDRRGLARRRRGARAGRARRPDRPSAVRVRDARRASPERKGPGSTLGEGLAPGPLAVPALVAQTRLTGGRRGRLSWLRRCSRASVSRAVRRSATSWVRCGCSMTTWCGSEVPGHIGSMPYTSAYFPGAKA